jgi:ubiquinone/menaquinone biosynthesis C-methylase UbiE
MAERAHPEDPGFQDKSFGLIKNKYKKKLFERYEHCNAFVREKEVLDIPCGVGWGTSLLKKVKSVVGIDISSEAIADANRIFSRKNINFVVGDMAKIPLHKDSIDIICCLEGLEHVDRTIGLRFLEESKRVIRNQGILIITCPVLNEQGETTGNPYHLIEYPEEELIDLFNKNFRILQLERIKGPDGPEYRSVLINIKEKKI